jgi:hypothetical protein
VSLLFNAQDCFHNLASGDLIWTGIGGIDLHVVMQGARLAPALDIAWHTNNNGILNISPNSLQDRRKTRELAGFGPTIRARGCDDAGFRVFCYYVMVDARSRSGSQRRRFRRIHEDSAL